jgi:hypothetical protein
MPSLKTGENVFEIFLTAVYIREGVFSHKVYCNAPRLVSTLGRRTSRRTLRSEIVPLFGWVPRRVAVRLNDLWSEAGAMLLL